MLVPWRVGKLHAAVLRRRTFLPKSLVHQCTSGVNAEALRQKARLFFQGKESGDFFFLFEGFWWLNCLMVLVA